MNIIEAIKSGKPFRRPNKLWLYRSDSGLRQLEGFTFTADNLIADDWEILEEPKKKVKMYQFAIKSGEGRWFLNGFFYKSKEEYLEDYDAEEIIRLDSTMIEVEE